MNRRMRRASKNVAEQAIISIIMKPAENGSPDAKPSKRVTLQDIADLAGVNRMVVSNALNNTRRVAPQTRERVQNIARELNYIPNFAARALRQGRTGIIAVISGPINEPYYGTMVHLLESQISAQGFHLMLMRTPREVRDLTHATGDVAVDGAIAVDMFGLVDEFRAHETIPCVSIGTHKRSFVDSVLIDLSAAVEEAIALMIAAGRQRIAYLVTADNMARETEVRARAYAKMMEKHGRAREIINLKSNSHAAQEQHFKSYLQQHGCPDALLCQNDDLAMRACKVARELGYQVPRDMLLAGCDGQEQMRYLTPPLSTIAQPVEEICALAWQFLQNRIAQPDLPRQEIRVQGSLIVTESLGSSR